MKQLKIVPFGKIPREILEEISEELRYSFKILSDILEPRELPKEFYNALRDQHLAEPILNFLLKKFKGNILAITDQDLYAEGLNFIFGQAQLNGRVAIISICRLDPKFYKEQNDNLLVKRAVKEAVHEVGHALFGLTHCNNSKCVMSFSNTIFDVDKKSKELCKNCKMKTGLFD
jgi:archaemetzincin